jgi:hypothetical protein
MATKELIKQINQLSEEKLEVVEKLVKQLLEESLHSQTFNQKFVNTKKEDIAHITKGLEEVKKIQAGKLPKKKIEDLLSGI